MATRSLGTLTLDLVAKIGGFEKGLDKAARTSKQRMDDIRRSTDRATKGLLALGAAGAAALTAVVVSSIRAAGEVNKLAALSGASTEAFQRYAAGAKALGVEQDKLADIFKDTGDKVGDFLQTGGGALADFFENIAPKVGVTAEQFRHLSGPQALELYVSSLERANVSQNEMTFFLEAIASDATALLPLLRNNAAGFRAFADAAGDAGAIMNDETIRAARELQAALFLTEQAGAGLKNQIAQEMLPVLSDFAVELERLSTDQAVTSELSDTLSDAVKGVTATAVGAVAAFRLLWKTVEGLLAVGEAADLKWYERFLPPLAAKKLIQNAGDVTSAFDDMGSELNDTALQFAKVLDAIWDAGEGKGKGDSRIKELADFFAQRDALLAKLRNGENPDSPGNGDMGQSDAIKQMIDGLREQAETLGFTERQMTLYRLAQQGAGDSQVTLTNQLYDQIEAFEQTADAVKALQSVIDRGVGPPEVSDFLGPEIFGIADIDAQLAEAKEAEAAYHAEQLEKLAEVYAQRTELDEQYREAKEQLEKEHADRLKQIDAKGNQEKKDVYADAFGAISNLGSEFQASVLSQSKKGFEISKAIAIAQATIDSYQLAVASYKALAGIPYVGPALGAAAAATAAAFGLAQVSAIQGTSFQGRRFGGGVSAGGMYEVAEPGNPELLRMGSKTLLMMGSQSGVVEPAKRISGDSAVGKSAGSAKINVHNYGGERVTTRQRSDGEIDILIGQAEDRAYRRSMEKFRSDFANREGVALAFESGYQAQRKGNRSGF